MKIARFFAFVPALLAALWLPRFVFALIVDGRIDVVQVLDFDASRPHFESVWFASLILMVLVHGWFARGLQKSAMYQMLALVAVAMAIRIALASQANAQNTDALEFDAIGMLATGFLAGGFMQSMRSVRNVAHPPKRIGGWVQWIAHIVTVLLSIVGSAVAASQLMNASEAFGARGGFGLLALFILLGIAVALHEGGHYLGARLSGMKVLLVRIMAIECHPRRGWWLLRWAPKSDHFYSGFVYAVPDPARPMRGQMMTMIAMGPMVSAMVCALCCLLAIAASQPQYVEAAEAFAMINGVIAMFTLVPRAGRVYTDGALLLHWWRHNDDKRPNLAYTRLTSCSVFGTTADALPEEDLQYIEKLPLPAPIIAMWYRLKGAQNRGDWGAALKIGEQFEQTLSEWNKPQAALATTIAHIRAEVAFSKVMATGYHDALNESILTRELKQLCPYLWPRCLALKAFLSGSEHEAKRLLQVAMHEANRSIDAALAKSEAMLGRYILEFKAKQAGAVDVH